MVLIAYLIPDEPSDIQEKVQRENYIIQEVMLKSQKPKQSTPSRKKSVQIQRLALIKKLTLIYVKYIQW